ncbi:hypothetical protein EYE42_12190 [Paracoccus subflavus]|uniref:Uncharacterized protein n=1 Tax=Paracoccus subflavus TaxID=2528244 RepID=A0A4Q9FZC1_9RHOB|nr:hypothetical protein [Paracoccus subflavus]TBN38646.1 hypothetical protein EYE42_12190 [Paracoccus subflavus]
MMVCILARWQPGIGDPGWRGWATVLLYLAAMVIAWRASRATFPPATRLRERSFWMLTALILGFLAVNKQLDLQSALTALGRCMAHAQGWYGQRRLVQVAFLAGLAIAGVVFVAALLHLLRGSWPRSALPVIGLVFVCTFVLMRAAGFHHMDRILGVPLLRLRANNVLEWTGPILIMLGALRVSYQRGRPVHHHTDRVLP